MGDIYKFFILFATTITCSMPTLHLQRKQRNRQHGLTL